MARRPLGPDPLQKDRRRFVVGVLGDQLTGKRLLENALPQPLGPLEAGIHGGVGLLDDRQPPLHLGHDAALLGQERDGDCGAADISLVDAGLIDCPLGVRSQQTAPKGRPQVVRNKR